MTPESVCTCHPDDDVQCGRCGSSMGWTDCEGCDGGEYVVEDPEGFGDEWVLCPACNGRGGWHVCLSDSVEKANDDEPTWCKTHPLAGREDTPCSTEEFFSVHQRGCALAPAVIGERSESRPVVTGPESAP